MSFFGFDTALPRDRGHQASAPGFGQTPDPWAGLAGRAAPNDDDALDFDETYDGLGDQLDERDDVFNDDTFGGEGNTGRDFDFSGQTAQVAGAMQEEQILYAARQPAPKEVPKPARTGYESYAQPNYIGNLEARADIWGTVPKKPTPVQQEQQRPPSQPPAAGPSRKMMSLEEVEQAMLAQTKKPAATSTPPPPGFGAPPPQPNYAQHPAFMGQSQVPQRPPQFVEQRPPSVPQPHQLPAELQGMPMPVHPQVLQHQRAQQEAMLNRQIPPQAQMSQMPMPPMPSMSPMPQAQQQPRHILQNPNRLSGQGQPLAQPMPRMPPTGPSHVRGPSYHQGPVITHPEQLLRMTDAERAAYLEEDARRAKRIHKIHLLSKDNGLMTPQDKNFITRIQLQQLVTATGGVDEQGAEAALAEDFYYQVYSQIRGAPRQNPHQPANQFAQTYLFQTGGRYGMAGRRHHRNGDNHIQRMEQQVQRAVEAAKAKPKNKQLVIEGSLGKISFSNAKTPKPLLNIKRTESGDVRPNSSGHRSKVHDRSVADKKATLRDIENVYNTLMQMEDHERNMPPPLAEGANPEAIQEHMEWRQRIEALNQKLWQVLKVMEPIIANSPVPHPFIAILSHPKGKKAIPRIFRHIDENQRITILTMIVVHLDTLDVIAHGIAPSPDVPLSRTVKEEIDLFANAVMPALFAIVNESSLQIVLGLLGLVLDRTAVQNVVRSKIGLSMLTMFVSRIELIKQSTPPGSTAQGDLQDIETHYNRLFDAIEPVLPYIFPGTVKDDEDVYVWQFLAAMGVGASAEQQQRLVLGVKDRVMDTVNVCKALPKELSAARLGHVNLFMRAIGLDVELLG